MNPRRRLFLLMVMCFASRAIAADAPDSAFQKPGAIIAADITGEVTATFGNQRKAVKPDERLRVDATVTSGRRSAAKLILSNGALVQLGPESELEFEEFGQQAYLGNPKFAEMKEEPSISRTRIRLALGEVNLDIKPLKIVRGSSFTFSFVAGTLRISEGAVRAMVRMSDLGLGVCSLELTSGKAEFEVLGGKFEPLRPGTKLAFAVEVEKGTGTVKIGEMPKAETKGGAKE